MELDSPVASRSIPRFAEIKSETQHADEASSTGEAPSESETLAALVSDLVHNCRQPSSNDSPMTSDHLDGDVTHGNTRFTHSRPITPTVRMTGFYNRRSLADELSRCRAPCNI